MSSAERVLVESCCFNYPRDYCVGRGCLCGCHPVRETEPDRLTDDELAAYAEDPSRLTFRDVRRLLDEIVRLREAAREHS